MMFRLPENSFSTRSFYSCPQVKLSPGSYHHPLPPPPTPPPHTHKSSSPSSRKGGGSYVNPQILVTFSPPRLIFDIGLFDFAAFLNYKNFNTPLGLEGFHPQFSLYLLTYTLFNSCHIHALPLYALPTYIFAVLNGH